MEKFCEKLVRYRVPLLILACVVAVAFPFVFPSKYFIRIGTVCLMYVMITLSLNLMGRLHGPDVLRPRGVYGHRRIYRGDFDNDL